VNEGIAGSQPANQGKSSKIRENDGVTPPAPHTSRAPSRTRFRREAGVSERENTASEQGNGGNGSRAEQSHYGSDVA
jgi:hypothetical protein